MMSEGVENTLQAPFECTLSKWNHSDRQIPTPLEPLNNHWPFIVGRNNSPYNVAFREPASKPRRILQLVSTVAKRTRPHAFGANGRPVVFSLKFEDNVRQFVSAHRHSLAQSRPQGPGSYPRNERELQALLTMEKRAMIV